MSKLKNKLVFEETISFVLVGTLLITIMMIWSFKHVISFLPILLYFFLIGSVVFGIKKNMDTNYEKNRNKWIVYQWLIFVGFIALRSFIEINVLKLQLWPPIKDFNHPNGKIVITIFLFSLQNAVFNLLVTYFLLSRRRVAMEIAYNKLKIENYENRMVMLNNQLSPHFLFNSLNDIYSTAVLKNDSTPEMILKLSDIMRFIVYETQKDDILLSEEINQIQNYINLHQINNPSANDIKLNVDENAGQVKVLPLILIPLLENAIKHGNTNDINSNAFISIDISKQKSQLHVLFQNTFKYSDHHINKEGIGMKNYISRLNLKYPDQYSFTETINNDIYESKLILNVDEK